MGVKVVNTFKAIDIALSTTEQNIYTMNVTGSGGMCQVIEEATVFCPDGVTNYVVRAYVNGCLYNEARAKDTDTTIPIGVVIPVNGKFELTVTSTSPGVDANFEGIITGGG